MNYFVHPTALIEGGVQIGKDSQIWDNVHIRRNARIGEQCIIGDKTHIAYEVQIGNRVKIGAFVNICPGVVIEDGVMVAMSVAFTNELFPRATTVDLKQLRPSSPTDRTLSTRVREGATIGGNATLRGGITIGRWAMIGMGSVVTHSVEDFHLVTGAPARPAGVVCRCGDLVMRGISDAGNVACRACGLRYAVRAGKVIELNPPR